MGKPIEKTKRMRLRDDITDEVAAMSRIDFSGNVIPTRWYSQIVNENGKPNMVAIILLSDVVYWYRWREVRDPKSGALKGHQKRFDGDFLQRSYRDIEAVFGFSKKQARTAFQLLERMDLCHQIFRTVGKLGNVMFLRPVPQRIALLNVGGLLPESNDPSDLEGTTLVTFKSLPLCPKGYDSTEITFTENTIQDIRALSAREKNDRVNAEKKAAKKIPPAPLKLSRGLGSATFDLERTYVEKIAMGGQPTEQEAIDLMAHYFTKVEEGQSWYRAQAKMLGATDDELTNVLLVIVPLINKSNKYDLRDWRGKLLPRVFNFMRYELNTERNLARRRDAKGGTKGQGRVAAARVVDNPSEFDYSTKKAFGNG